MSHTHSILDDDLYFAIDPYSREISYLLDEPLIISQTDHNSEEITFEIPRYVDGHDMSKCNVVQVHYINVSLDKASSNADVYEVGSLQPHPEDENILIGTWLVSQNATMYVGSLTFAVRFACTTGLTVDYSWSSGIYRSIEISETYSNAGKLVDEYSDVLQKWYEEFKAISIVNQEAVDQVNKTAAEVEASMAEVEASKAEIRNSYANAIKEVASGTVVRVDDVSPLEHEVKAKIRGKNLLDIDAGLNRFLVKNDDGTYTLTRGANRFSEDIPISIPANTTITISCVGLLDEGFRSLTVLIKFADGTTDYVNMTSAVKTYVRTFNKDINKMAIYLLPDAAEGDYKTFTGIQVEYGDTATEYVPYVDPSTVMVEKYRKNLIPPHETNEQGGYTVTKNIDGSVSVEGASATEGAIYLNLSSATDRPVDLMKGIQYSLKWKSSNNRNGYIKLVDINGSNVWITLQNGQTLLSGSAYTKIVQLYVQIGASTQTDPNAIGDTSLCGTYYFQLEVGDKMTDFAPYVEPETFTPNADGIVEGMTSLSPTMTVTTDAANAIVELEYNQDLNTVVEAINNLLEKILNGGA